MRMWQLAILAGCISGTGASAALVEASGSVKEYTSMGDASYQYVRSLSGSITSPYSLTKSLIVGETGYGKMTVNSGGKWTYVPAKTNEFINLGGASGADVAISGGQWNTAGKVYVGGKAFGLGASSGHVTISNNGKWTSSSGLNAIGPWVGTTGSVHVASGGVLSSGGEFVVGYQGYGDMQISEGCSWTQTSALTLGGESGSTGRASFEAGGVLNSSGSVTVGGTGVGLMYFDGGRWTHTGSSLLLGDDVSGAGLISLEDGAAMNVSGSVFIGTGGIGILQAQGGCTLTFGGANYFVLGFLDDSSGLCYLKSSEADIEDWVILGGYGSGSIKLIDHAAMTTHDAVDLGRFGGSGEVVLSDSSTWNCLSDISMSGASGSIEIGTNSTLALSNAGLSAGATLSEIWLHEGTIRAEGTSSLDFSHAVFHGIYGSGTLDGVTIVDGLIYCGKPGEASSAGYALNNVHFDKTARTRIVLHVTGSSRSNHLICDSMTDLSGADVEISFDNGFIPSADMTWQVLTVPGGAEQLAAATLSLPDGWELSSSGQLQVIGGSAFRITGIAELHGESAVLAWESATGWEYQVESSLGSPTNFCSCSEWLQATPPQNVHTSSVATASSRFFRVVRRGSNNPALLRK